MTITAARHVADRYGTIHRIAADDDREVLLTACGIYEPAGSRHGGPPTCPECFALLGERR